MRVVTTGTDLLPVVKSLDSEERVSQDWGMRKTFTTSQPATSREDTVTLELELALADLRRERLNEQIINDQNQAGTLAAAKEVFGEHGRFAIAPVHTRFNSIEWFVWDAELEDEVTGGPAVIRQETTRGAALRGLVR